MAAFIFGFVIILLAIVGLALGVMAGRGPLKGSCGGIACAGRCVGCPRRRKAGR